MFDRFTKYLLVSIGICLAILALKPTKVNIIGDMKSKESVLD
ncbi:hypothetical protein [Abyssisolibacter fermentans]|nr:hypothetical protein [Abyssisolibacter fermentans]